MIHFRLISPFVIVSILLLFNSFWLSAQELPHALLWEIRGKNLQNPSYLYGTIHAICPKDMLLSKETLKALDASQKLVLEIDITDPQLAAKMQDGMLMKGKDRLSSLLPSGDFKVLASYFRDSLGMEVSAVEKMQPIFLSALIYNKLLACPVQSYENRLGQMASFQKMEIAGLETIEEQLQVFEHMSYKEQAEMLLQTIIEYPELEASYWNMIVSYKNQDLNSLYHIITDIQLGMKKYEDVMLFERNQRWVPRIELLAADKPTFFAVGAAHLPGNKGLIALLQRRGYQLVPIF